MSTRRNKTWDEFPKRTCPDSGKHLCRRPECSKPLAGRRTSWCSSACSRAVAILVKPSSARWAVWHRDHGRCSACGLDTAALEREWERMRYFRAGRHHDNPERLERCLWFLRRVAKHGYVVPSEGVFLREGPPPGSFAELASAYAARTRAMVDLVASFNPQGWWQADHRLEVADGGGECGLDNLVTLCTPCHKKKSAASRRARSKKDEGRRLQGPPQGGEEAGRGGP